MRLRPKNWSEFQHYKDRSPPWIKLHNGLLDDRAFNALPLASMALAPLLWLIASASKDGSFDGSAEEIAFRLRWKVKNVEDGLSALIASGFFVVVQDASEPLAECLHVAAPETEGETEAQVERQRQKLRASRFDEFWKACSKKAGKGAARKAFAKVSKTTDPEVLIAGIRRYSAAEAGKDPQFTKHPATWLNQECWLDEAPGTGPPALRLISAETEAQERENLKRLGVI